MPKRRGAGAAKDDSATATAFLPDQQVLEFICKSVCGDNDHWQPSKSLAKCLGLPLARLILLAQKDHLTNRIWTTVVVLSIFATRFADSHESWYELADAAAAWLYRQMYFVEHREDLVRSACSLLNLLDPDSLLTTLFCPPKDEETLALEEALGDWKQCYLQEPPYSLYYWNEKTNQSTWRNPIETAKLEKERLEKMRLKQEILAKVLPQRVKINRDAYVLPKVRFCNICERAGREERYAHVLCLACDSQYFCNSCCDEVHSDFRKLSHLESNLRFQDCFGTKGFSRDPVHIVLPQINTKTQ